MFGPERSHVGPQRLYLRGRFGVVLQIQPDAADALQLPGELFINIVPALFVFLEEFIKFRCVVYAKAVVTQRGQVVCHAFNGLRPGFDGDFQPFHVMRLHSV